MMTETNEPNQITGPNAGGRRQSPIRMSPPARVGQFQRSVQMQSFHRTKRDSRILIFVGLCTAFLLSVIFMLVGFMGNRESGFDSFRLIFGIAGICLFVIFVRGGWMATGGALTHVFSINETEIEWGFVGREKRMD